jgi:hypothetical protein
MWYYTRYYFVLVKETPKARRIKLKHSSSDINGLTFWMPKSVTKKYDDRDPNIKSAWFWDLLFDKNIHKAAYERNKKLNEVE